MMNIGKSALIAVSLIAANPANASEITIENSLCPFDSLTDEELGAVVETTLNEKDTPPTIEAKVEAAIEACATKYGWTDADTDQIVKFDMFVLSQTYLADVLTQAGADVGVVDTMIQDATLEELEASMADSDDRPLLKKGYDILTKQLGSKMTEELDGMAVAYVISAGQARLLAGPLFAAP